MELIVIIIVSIILFIITEVIFKTNAKKIEEIANDEKLNKLAEVYPSNIEICKDILSKLKNESVTIEEDKNSNSTLYIALSNKICISDTKNSYTRIQTMAHECLHSIQNRKMLMFNFIFSNIYIIYFFIIIALTILKIITHSMLLLNIFLMFSLTYYMTRVFLENDAMIKAKYLAKEYMEEKNISTREEINEIVEGFDKLNEEGIKLVNHHFFKGILIKVIIFSIVALIF